VKPSVGGESVNTEVVGTKRRKKNRKNLARRLPQMALSLPGIGAGNEHEQRLQG